MRQWEGQLQRFAPSLPVYSCYKRENELDLSALFSPKIDWQVVAVRDGKVRLRRVGLAFVAHHVVVLSTLTFLSQVVSWMTHTRLLTHSPTHTLSHLHCSPTHIEPGHGDLQGHPLEAGRRGREPGLRHFRGAWCLCTCTLSKTHPCTHAHTHPQQSNRLNLLCGLFADCRWVMTGTPTVDRNVITASADLVCVLCACVCVCVLDSVHVHNAPTGPSPAAARLPAGARVVQVLC